MKLKVISRKKYSLHFSIRPLDFSLQIRKNKSKLLFKLGSVMIFKFVQSF
eukprot:UN27180